MTEYKPYKSKWARAHIIAEWRGSVGPLARKAYNKGSEEAADPALCDRLAERLEGFARTAREAARLAREEAAR